MSDYLDLFYSYLLFNALLALGYFITRACIGFANSKFILSQAMQLRLLKISFSLLLICLLLLPTLFPSWLSHEASSFQVQPFLKNTTTELLIHTELKSHPPAFPKIDMTIDFFQPLFILLLLGTVSIIYTAARYCSHLRQLLQLTRRSYAYKTIGRLHILMNDTIVTPFCWSFFTTSYIFLPYTCIAHPKLLKAYVLHEMQHIRQKDTSWQHILSALHIVCFWNPWLPAWKKYFTDLQEYACDEALVVKQRLSPVDYAQALVSSAESALKDATTNFWGLSHFLGKAHLSMLTRRTEKLFTYQALTLSRLRFYSLIGTLLLIFSTLSYAVNSHNKHEPMNVVQLHTLIARNHLETSVNMPTNANILLAMNAILSSPKTTQFMQVGLDNFKNYQSLITTAMDEQALPHALFALPLAESGYANLPPHPYAATAGLWQFIPQTAKSFGLVVTATRDDRLDPQLSTLAATRYLHALHTQFPNWQLTLAAYHYGEVPLQEVLQQYNTDDIWYIVEQDPKFAELKRYLSITNATIIIMSEPALLQRHFHHE